METGYKLNWEPLNLCSCLKLLKPKPKPKPNQRKYLKPYFWRHVNVNEQRAIIPGRQKYTKQIWGLPPAFCFERMLCSPVRRGLRWSVMDFWPMEMEMWVGGDHGCKSLMTEAVRRESITERGVRMSSEGTCSGIQLRTDQRIHLNKLLKTKKRIKSMD